MKRANRWLLLVIVVEIIAGGVFIGRQLARLVPPEPNWALVDPASAAELRAARSTCKTAEDWRKLGELYMAEGCFRESEMCHRVACQLAPDDATCTLQWAFALERLGLLEEANAQYRRTAELKQDAANACAYFIGRNLLRADKLQEARTTFAEGKALDANRYELARLHLRAGEFVQAEGLLHSFSGRENVLQVRLLGYRLAFERGDLRQARVHADNVRYATEKLFTPFDEEAARVVKVTQLLGARRQWKEARDLIEAGKLDAAEKTLLDAKQANPDPTLDELMAELMLRRGQFREAATLFETCEARNGPSARIAARLGEVWAAAGQHDKARANWLRAARLEAGANLKDVHHKLARSFRLAGDKAAADRHLARGHYYVGRDLLQFGYPQKAVAYFAATGKHDPDMAQAWFYLGEARRRAGEAGAVEAYRACLKLNPDHGRALTGLAMVN